MPNWTDFEAVDEPQQHSWDDFEPYEEPVKRNILGESKEDLIKKMRQAQFEGLVGQSAQDMLTKGEQVAQGLANPIGAATRLISEPLNALAKVVGVGPVASEFKGVNFEGASDAPLQMVEEGLRLPPGSLRGPESPVHGVAQSVEQTASGLTKPEMLATLPVFAPAASAALPVAATLGKSLMAGEAIKEIPEAFRQASIADVMNPAEVFGKMTGATTQFGMGAAMAHGAGPKEPPPMPEIARTGDITVEQPETKGIEDARTISQTSPIYENVRSLTGESIQKVPTKESGEGILPSRPEETQPPVSLKKGEIDPNTGARFDGAAAGDWTFTALTPDGKESTEFRVKAGSTPEQIRAKYEQTRQRYEGESDQPAPLPELAKESEIAPQTEAQPTYSNKDIAKLRMLRQKLERATTPEKKAEIQKRIDEVKPVEAQEDLQRQLAEEQEGGGIGGAIQRAIDKNKEAGAVNLPSVDEVLSRGRELFEKTKDFASWSVDMVKQFGDWIKDHVQGIWDHVRGIDSEASQVSRMSPEEFQKFAPTGATNKGYDLAKRIGTEGHRESLADYEKATVAELQAKMKELAAAKTPEEQAKVFADAQALNAKKQYFNEAQRMLKAADDVRTGKSPTESAKSNGVMERDLAKFFEEPKGLAKNVRNVSAMAGEGGFLGVDLNKLSKRLNRARRDAVQYGKDLAKEQLGGKRMTDYRKSILNWSAKLQRSFGESMAAQKDLVKRVPDLEKRQGIVNWIQADGDHTVLANRAAATTDPTLRKGYLAAMTLTPEEVAVANDVRARYNALAAKANRYGILNSFKDNYVTQLWDLKKGPTGGASSRTLRDRFRFSKARSFDNYFEGEQAGFVPKGDKDIAQLLPVYMHEMESVIAARELVEEMQNGTASDGRPLLAPRGAGMPVTNAKGQATLVMPKAIKGNTADYRVMADQPALHDWIFSSTDSAGNPVLLKADLAVHPEAVGRLKAALGKSAIREWYDTKTSAGAAIPKAIVKGIDNANAITKRTMLGLFAPFHQVQEGTHAVGHRVNPFTNIPKVDLVNDRGQMDAAKHGLMLLPDRASENQFMEGFKPSGLVSRIPVVGKMADFYSNYLFHQYIPWLKYKTYSAILERNNGVYAKDLASGSVSPADVKVLSAEQTNAAFGHLNYADLARNPTIQHLMQLGLLAPDFLEARTRFTGQAIKGVTGAKAGREQLLALATLAVAQAAAAYTAAQLSGGEWDKKDPFAFRLGNRKYTMRSVPEDIVSLTKDARLFAHSRLSPIIGKGALQYASGVDYRGKKVSAGETTKELLQQPIPISVRGFMGIGKSSLTGLEQLAGAVGLKISRDTASMDVSSAARDWMAKSTNPKIQQLYKEQQESTYPDSIYKPLKGAVDKNDVDAIKKEYQSLLDAEPTQKDKDKRKALILREFNPFRMPKDSYNVKVAPLFTRSREVEEAFIKSLDNEGKQRYKQAVREKVQAYLTLSKALTGKASYPPGTPAEYR